MKEHNILFITFEDRQYLSEKVSGILKSEGYNVDFGSDILDAVNKIKHGTKRYDVILIDHNLNELHGISGIDIYEIAREENRDLKAILILDFGSKQEIKDDALSKGIDQFIEKPFTVTDILDTIDNMVRRKPGKSSKIKSVFK